MPNLNSSPKPHRRGQEAAKDRRRRLPEKSSSFHVNRPPVKPDATKPLHRPRTAPELLNGKSVVLQPPQELPRLTKLLLNVTVLGAVGPVQVIIAPDLTVGDLIATAVKQYVKDGRRPILPNAAASSFDLHYSQFSLESLDRQEKLIALGSRNFFLCPRKLPENGGCSVKVPVIGSCSGEAEEVRKSGFNWLKFMDFMK